jgi:DNA polymerase-4/protein ImuB
MKVACVLITHLPVKAEMRRDSALNNKAVLITTQSIGGAQVLDFSSQAKGVSTGMSLQEALSRCKGAVLIEADEIYYHQMFDRIVGALLDKSPLVEKGELGCTFLDMHGTEGIYGGDEGIIDTLLDAVPSHFGPRVGLAESKFPAYVAAVASRPGQATRVPRGVASFLKELPIDLLPLSWEDRVRLHDFGLHTMGQIASLSVGSMQAQFGTQGRVAWELANGIDKSPFISSKHREAVTDFITFPVPATSLSAILPAVDILLGRVLSHPSLRGKYLRSVSIQANVLNRSPWSKKLAFKSPVNRKEAALFVFRNALETIEIPGPLEDIRMTVFDTAGESGRQTSLFLEVRKQEQLAEMIRQLEVRLRAKPPIYKVMDVEPWSRIPERRQALVEFVP